MIGPIRWALLPMLCCTGVALSANAPPKPPQAPSDIPDARITRPLTQCVECDQPFDGATHEAVLKDLLKNPYQTQLRKALWLQDSAHQFESKAHFDNCDFEGAVGYIDALLEKTDGDVQAAVRARERGDDADTQRRGEQAFFAIGQALHAVQDFYAHSNYVELQAPQAKRVEDIEVLPVWRPKGRERLALLRQQGLVSGYVFWGFPQRCASGALSHGELAKDKESTKSGSARVAHLRNISQYRIAAFLAREASFLLLRDAFKRWPLLRDLNGENAAIDVLIDRRGV